MYSTFFTNNKIQSANQSSTRIVNRLNIIELLLHTGEMSRSELSKSSGLSKPTITENVDWLLGERIILESREGKTTRKGGRRPIYLKFNNTFCYIIAIDLSPLHPICIIGDLSGNIIKERKVILDNLSSNKEVLELFTKNINNLLDDINIKKTDIGIIVISSPGIIAEDYIITNPQFKDLAEINLKKILHKIYRVPVILKNDMNFAAVGEHVLGHGKDTDSMIYVGIGKGLGSGIILNNTLYEGRSFSAGEIDFFISEELLEKDKTLEQEIAIDGLIKNLIEKIESQLRDDKKISTSVILKIYRDNKKIKFKDIVLAYNKKDALVLEYLKQVGRHLGITLNNINVLLDLDLIVIGGEYLAFYDVLEKEIKEIINRYSPHNPPVIKKTALKEKSSIYGAFIVARDNYLQLLKL